LIITLHEEFKDRYRQGHRADDEQESANKTRALMYQDDSTAGDSYGWTDDETIGTHRRRESTEMAELLAKSVFHRIEASERNQGKGFANSW